MIHDLARAIDIGFRRIASGSPATLEAAKVKPLVHNLLTGNSVRTITIDGTEYVVPDGVTLLESATAAGIGFVLDFGITPKLTSKARIIFTPIEGNNTGFGGARKDADYVRFSITTFSSGAKFAFAMTANTWSDNKTDLVVGQRYDCTAYNGKQIINGTEYNETVLASLNNTDATFKICAVDGAGGAASATRLNAKYEIVYLWEGETPVLLGHPAIKNGVVGYYDLVTGGFITPTVGTLTAGASLPTPEQTLGVKSCGEKYINIFGAHYPVPKGVKLLEYIDISNGKIDTGIQANPAYTNTRMRVCMTQLSGTTALFGARGTTSSSTKSYNIFGAVSGGGGRFDNVSPSQPHTFSVDTWYDIALWHDGAKGSVIIDGTLLYTGTQNMENEDVGNIYIGSLNNNGTDFGTRTPAKWGTVSILANGVDFSAVLHPAQMGAQVGMYDFIRKTFIAADGTVSAGPEATLEYKLTELLASNCGMVDMGTLEWTDQGSYYRTSLSGADFPSSTSVVAGLYVNGYTTVPAGELADGTIAGRKPSATPYIYLQDSSVHSVEELVSKIRGKTLFYKRTTDAWTPPTTITAYIDKPLGKVGDYADTLDYASGTITRRVGVKVLDGTENWSLQQGSAYYRYGATIVQDAITPTTNIICTHGTGGTNRGQWRIASGMLMRYDSDSSPDFANVDDFKSWLAAQYAAGTPVTVYYPLATPVTTQHTAVAVTPAQGTNYVESTNAVKGAVTAEYRSRGAR